MMAWEHALLGDLDPARMAAAAAGDTTGLDGYRDALTALGEAPRRANPGRLARSGLAAVRLPGSGLTVTVGELNYLPDYLGTPAQVEQAPLRFLGPLVQSVRSWSIAELRRQVWLSADGAGRVGRVGGGRVGGGPGPIRLPRQPLLPRLLPGSLRYPVLGALAETAEIAAVDSLGRACGFAPEDRYSAVLGRNAGHFAPFSWYRWHSFHLAARELIARSADAGPADRATLRLRARVCAGYADHFLQDSFAAGHQINKTLLMQWYIEWLEAAGVAYPGRETLSAMTVDRQPRLHGPGLYDRQAARSALGGTAPGGRVPGAPWDPQDLRDAPTLEERIAASGVAGDTDAERRAAYAAYLTMLSSGVAQLAVKVVHEYLNKRSLVVAAAPDGPAFRIYGDHTMLASADGTARASAAAAASRRAITELLEAGSTSVSSWEIFDSFPSHVKQDGRLVSLADWHAEGLRDLCFGELFPRWSTQAMRAIMSAGVFRQLGTPAPEAQLVQ
jgi:hypothetical protein